MSIISTEKLEGLTKEVSGLLLAKDLTLGLAESCTGGLLAAAITDIPGSSEYFNGSIVAYRNKVKKKVLKVTTPCLRKFGAVSAETAAAMARGARKATTARIGLSITGIAGPDGGTKDKPVGLVYIGLDARKLPLTLPSPLRGEDKSEGDKKRNSQAIKLRMVRQFNFSGNRPEIRQAACIKALELLKEFLEKVKSPDCNHNRIIQRKRD
ncbi:MAG: CinA family protein [Candidatus Omnitrophica bacterium]|nr:CinA family protein [Candidatus Omnitrophota bacterium]